MGGRVAVSGRITCSSAGRREGAGFSTAHVSSTSPAFAAISPHRPTSGRPWPGRFWTTRRRYDALSSQSSRLWPSNRRPCPDSRATGYRDSSRSSSSGRCAGDGFASLGGAGDWSPSGVPVWRSGGASGRALGLSVDGACAYRRFQLRLRIIIAVRGRWTCVVDRISSRRTLGVVVELMHRVATHFTHGRPPPLGRSRVLICHTRGAMAMPYPRAGGPLGTG